MPTTPVREPQVTNQRGDDAATPQAAAAKVRMLMERLKGGTSFRDLAVAYSEDAESAPRGGDLGLVPVSSLKQAPPQLRDAVLGKTPGSVNVASAGGAYTLVLVVAHEQAGQRDLSTAGVKDRISETLRSRKEQLFRAAYLTAARSDATVVNYLARRLVESKGAAPNHLPSAPRQKSAASRIGTTRGSSISAARTRRAWCHAATCVTGELTIAEAHRNTMITKVLAVYSTVLTTLLAAFTRAGSAAAKVQRFDEIDVHSHQRS